MPCNGCPEKPSLSGAIHVVYTSGPPSAPFAAVARAIELGKPKEQFLHDDDFAEHLDRPRMKELLGD